VPIPVSAAMRVRLTDPALVDDLERFLLATECLVKRLGANELDVYVPRAPNEAQARREIGVYLLTWRAMNPNAVASLSV
jgi:hypothetical protein